MVFDLPHLSYPLSERYGRRSRSNSVLISSSFRTEPDFERYRRCLAPDGNDVVSTPDGNEGTSPPNGTAVDGTSITGMRHSMIATVDRTSTHDRGRSTRGWNGTAAPGEMVPQIQEKRHAESKRNGTPSLREMVRRIQEKRYDGSGMGWRWCRNFSLTYPEKPPRSAIPTRRP